MLRAARLTLSTRPLAKRARIPNNINSFKQFQSDAPVSTSKSSAEEQRRSGAGITLNRFWKKVNVAENDGILTITLDKRPLRTPEGARLEIPRTHRVLATLVAIEWENQEKLIKHHALPMTSIVSRAIDGLNHEGMRIGLVAGLLKYLETDTICFHETHPPTLVKLQEEHWEPLINWAESTYGVRINKFESILGNTQPAETKEAFAKAANKLDQWEMAAFERAVLTTKSFIIALALVKGQIDVEQAARAAHVEVVSQTMRWGEVEDTHDVDYHHIRRQLGSVACVLAIN
ncbi:ATP synthase mitochondrial F1 complex assembly factor 2 [Ceratobasidium theobromae]|uniref:ATP synthase mitochondrial F1 complex assembly factor 2 n=1 Tax=Ceratobasidium theobromae TaxID=1582974 RepID=A0A5N5QLG1_9AGAM|nr:ATP synthase mitochondrial F1 complex assembly factor 2 [Ceratobasidium theobromae]